MKWRRVSEAEVLSVLDDPNRTEESVDERNNAYKQVRDRWLKVTHKENAGNAVSITVSRKNVLEDSDED